MKKSGKKTGTINLSGNGVNKLAIYHAFSPDAQSRIDRAVKLDKRLARKAEKTLKRANKLGGYSLALGAAGAGAYQYGKYKSKKNKQQKEFNSKAQKLLRRASDYKKAMTGQGRLLQGEASQINKGMNSFGNPGNSFIRQGRELNKSILTRPYNINTKINQRAGYTHAV